MRSHCRGKVKFKSRSFESRFVVMHEIVGLVCYVISIERSRQRDNWKEERRKGGVFV